MENFYTIAGVSQLLSLAETTVRKLVRNGELEHTRFGRAIRISERQLQDYINRQQKKNNEEGDEQ